jgi:hypothetical protein
MLFAGFCATTKTLVMGPRFRGDDRSCELWLFARNLRATFSFNK